MPESPSHPTRESFERAGAPGWHDARPVPPAGARQASGESPASSFGPVGGSPGSGIRPQAPKPRWYRNSWIIAATALVLGVAIGSVAAASDPTASSEYKLLTADLNDRDAQLATAQTDVDAAREELAQTKGELESARNDATSAQEQMVKLKGDLPKREAALKVERSRLNSRAAKLETREASLRDAESAVAKRERAVGIVEQEIKSNTVAGDGIYEVGTDMKPGTYKSTGNSDCYYAINNDANGNSIDSNNIVSGNAVVQVPAGKFFETTRCSDWVLQP